VGRVVYGATDPKVGVSRWLDTLDGAALNHRFTLEGGLLEPECRDQIQAFFKRRR
jgi:tRNA(adenine34) deaminase